MRYEKVPKWREMGKAREKYTGKERTGTNLKTREMRQQGRKKGRKEGVVYN